MIVGVSVTVGVFDAVGVIVSNRMPFCATVVANTGSVFEPYGIGIAVLVGVPVMVAVFVTVLVVVAVSEAVGVAV